MTSARKFKKIIHALLTHQKDYLLPLLMIMAAFFLLYRLGSEPLDAWDESRNGVNAFEFIERGDPVNMYYGRALEEWNVKPPLLIWGIAFFYKILGFNVFSMRLTSALGALLAFYFLYRITRLYESRVFASVTCLILMTCNGIAGNHVGRTGDYDGLLLGLLMSGGFFFLKAIKETLLRRRDLIIAAVCWGMAFYAKGFVFVALFPGLILYCFWTKKVGMLLKNKYFWLSIAILLAFPLSWYFIIQIWGLPHSGRYGKDAFDTMLFYDIGKRISDNRFEEGANSGNYLMIIHYLDTYFNLWNYLLYGITIYVIYEVIKTKINLILFFQGQMTGLLKVSFCIAISWGVIITLAGTKHFWYLVPSLPFVGIILTYGIRFIHKRHSWFPVVVVFLLLFTVGRKIYDYHQVQAPPHLISANHDSFREASQIAHYGIIQDQHILLYLYFFNKKNIFIYDTATIKELPKGALLVLGKKRNPVDSSMLSQYSALYEDRDYQLLKKE